LRRGSLNLRLVDKADIGQIVVVGNDAQAAQHPAVDGREADAQNWQGAVHEAERRAGVNDHGVLMVQVTMGEVSAS